MPKYIVRRSDIDSVATIVAPNDHEITENIETRLRSDIESTGSAMESQVVGITVARDGWPLHRAVALMIDGVCFVRIADHDLDECMAWRADPPRPQQPELKDLYTVVLLDCEYNSLVTAETDEEAMEQACQLAVDFRLDREEPGGGDSYMFTPFALYRDRDGVLAGIGMMCAFTTIDADQPGLEEMHLRAFELNRLLDWFDGEDARWPQFRAQLDEAVSNWENSFINPRPAVKTAIEHGILPEGTTHDTSQMAHGDALRLAVWVAWGGKELPPSLAHYAEVAQQEAEQAERIVYQYTRRAGFMSLMADLIRETEAA